MGSEKCKPGCTCGRHSPRGKNEPRKKCKPGCKCGRHSGNGHGCPDGCTCNRHKIPKCEPGCTCYRHNGKTYNDTTYDANHARVRRERGKASSQKCVDCQGNATEWSHTHGADPTNPQSYNPRCNKCHRAYDGISERLTGRVLSAETRAKLSKIAKNRRKV